MLDEGRVSGRAYASGVLWRGLAAAVLVARTTGMVVRRWEASDGGHFRVSYTPEIVSHRVSHALDASRTTRHLQKLGLSCGGRRSVELISAADVVPRGL